MAVVRPRDPLLLVCLQAQGDLLRIGGNSTIFLIERFYYFQEQ
jgi:hypothetical protein